MPWAEGFIAVDWGTTNRRAYRIGPGGDLSAKLSDGRGILSIGPGRFPDAMAELRAELGDLPFLMAGMVGSNLGWMEASYIACAAGLPELASTLSWPEPGRVAIVPGLSYMCGEAADVMRGEEVQLLGARAARMIPSDALVCHPGTHSKWARLSGDCIEAFKTVMTGELFSMLKQHSILADLLRAPVIVNEAFAAGVRHGLCEDDLMAELFSVRARVLLGKAPAANAGSYVSGLLIGSDIRIGLQFAGDGEIVVIGEPKLTALFAHALALAGRPGRQIEGEQAFLAGARSLAELIR